MLIINIKRSILFMTAFGAISSYAADSDQSHLLCQENLSQSMQTEAVPDPDTDLQKSKVIESFVSKFVINYVQSLKEFDIDLSNEQIDSIYQRLHYLFENTPACIKDDLGGDEFFEKSREFTIKTMEYYQEDLIDVLLTSINIAMKLYSDTFEYSLENLCDIRKNLFNGLKLPGESILNKNKSYFASIEIKVLISIGILSPDI